MSHGIRVTVDGRSDEARSASGEPTGEGTEYKRWVETDAADLLTSRTTRQGQDRVHGRAPAAPGSQAPAGAGDGRRARPGVAMRGGGRRVAAAYGARRCRVHRVPPGPCRSGGPGRFVTVGRAPPAPRRARRAVAGRSRSRKPNPGSW